MSYSTFEELTELTFDATKEKRLTPNGMSLNPANNIGVAFDNFDIYVETVSGKDTLRDTVGFYLPQINQSPTSVAVVAETMKRAQKIAEEN